jgi:hypothetical protein
MNPAPSTKGRAHFALRHHAAFPLEGHFESSPRPESSDPAFGPGPGNDREELDSPVMTLEEHFGDACTKAEGAVQL